MCSNWKYAARIAFAMAVAVWSGSPVCGQTDPAMTDTVSLSRLRVYPLPVLFYTPETGLAGGAAAVMLVRSLGNTRASSIAGDAIYTAKRQIIIELGSDLYFDQGTYRLQANASYRKFPYKFYGIGNNTAETLEEAYTPQVLVASLRVDRNLFSRFNVGPLLRVENVSMKEIAPQGSLATGTLPGSQGGTSVGAGIAANWDSRDNTFAAEEGSLCQLTAMAYRKELGSKYDYTVVGFDARKYFRIVPGQVLAVQVAAQSVRGTVPFQSLTTFGGQNTIRGYFEGRYRDNDGVGLQAEYRAHLWWRLGLVAFAGTAQVADRFNRLAIGKFWCAAGAGLRYEWNPDERVNLRLDYGVGNNSAGMYITVNEAI